MGAIDREVPMKVALLISTAAAILVAAVLASASTAGRSSVLPGFRSPTGNIHCFYNPDARTSGVRAPSLTCGLNHADYAMTLQRRCEAGDWHGFEFAAGRKPSLFCPGGASGQHIAYRTLAYGKGWRRGAFTCTSRRIGVTCRSAKGHGLFISRESYRLW
jgi:hypothetical protein